jgi:hypothetical protein
MERTADLGRCVEERASSGVNPRCSRRRTRSWIRKDLKTCSVDLR